MARLRSPAGGTRCAAIDALGTEGGPLRCAEDLWEIVEDDLIDLRERGSALECLERHGPIDADHVRERAPLLHPYVRHFAARCLIRAGERAGVLMLVRLLEVDEFQFGVGERETAEVRYATRRVLADLSGLAPQTSVQRWHDWLATAEEIRFERLGPSRVGLR